MTGAGRGCRLAPRRTAVVDADALRANLEAATGRGAPGVDLRADAYGLGAELVLRLLAGTASERGRRGGRTLAPVLYGACAAARPVVRLAAELVSVKEVGPGQGVSYGAVYTTDRATRLGLVALGYADGVVRRASDSGPVLVAGVRLRIAGRVAMDQFVVDLGDAPGEAGDEAVLFGDPGRGEPSLLEWSAVTGWPPLALLAGLGPRIERSVRCDP